MRLHETCMLIAESWDVIFKVWGNRPFFICCPNAAMGMCFKTAITIDMLPNRLLLADWNWKTVVQFHSNVRNYELALSMYWTWVPHSFIRKIGLIVSFHYLTKSWWSKQTSGCSSFSILHSSYRCKKKLWWLIVLIDCSKFKHQMILYLKLIK